MGLKKVCGITMRIPDKAEDRVAKLKYTITLVLTGGDFERQVGRPARDRKEFEKWGRLCEKGLDEGYIDWEIVFKVARGVLINPNRYRPAQG